MRIGILGPPEVGKSKLARALAKKFSLKVIDNYAQRIQTRTDLALGPWSRYNENYMIAGVRLFEEYKSARQSCVTVGTIVDTIVYAATHSDVVLHNSRDGARAAYIAAQGAMQGLSLIYAETFDYDISFYLPYSEDKVKELGRSWNTALDEAYLPVIESYGIPYVYQLRGTPAERIKNATEIIDLAQEEPSTETSQASSSD